MRGLLHDERSRAPFCHRRTHTFGLGGDCLGSVGDPGLVRWSDPNVGGLSELARLGSHAGDALHIRAHSNLAHAPRLDFSLGRSAREGDSLGDDLGPVGLAVTGAQGLSSPPQLALVAGCCDCGARGRQRCPAISSRACHTEPYRIRCGPWYSNSAGAYLLAVVSWVMLLAWAAVLLRRSGRPTGRPEMRMRDRSSALRAAWTKMPSRLPLPEGGGDSAGKA